MYRTCSLSDRDRAHDVSKEYSCKERGKEQNSKLYARVSPSPCREVIPHFSHCAHGGAGARRRAAHLTASVVGLCRPPRTTVHLIMHIRRMRRSARVAQLAIQLYDAPSRLTDHHTSDRTASGDSPRRRRPCPPSKTIGTLRPPPLSSGMFDGAVSARMGSAGMQALPPPPPLLTAKVASAIDYRERRRVPALAGAHAANGARAATQGSHQAARIRRALITRQDCARCGAVAWEQLAASVRAWPPVLASAGSQQTVQSRGRTRMRPQPSPLLLPSSRCRRRRHCRRRRAESWRARRAVWSSVAGL